MTTYNEIAGRRVNFLSSDPTYVDTNSDGQVWYNSTTATLKSWLPTGAWSSGGALPTGNAFASAFGTQSAGVYATGDTGSPTAASYNYNGIAWTASGNVNTARYGLGQGTQSPQTAGVIFGGTQTYPTMLASTESYNGSTWTSGNNMNTARQAVAGTGTQTASVAAGGETPGGYGNAVENYNGTSWTSGTNFPSSPGGGLTGIGLQTASIFVASGVSQSYNGSAWTTAPSQNTALNRRLSFGTTSAGISAGGTPPTSTNSESYNGTAWTSNPTGLTTARYSAKGGGSGTSGFGSGGYTGTAYSTATEEWNFGVYSYTAAAWASGGNLNTGRYGLAGAGSQTAGLAFGGESPTTTASESYNGTSWTATPSLNTARNELASSKIGTNTAALAFGGHTGTYPTQTISSATESFNGSAWTSVNSMNTARRALGGTGLQTASLAFGGFTTANTGATETWNGTSWTTSPATLNTARRYVDGAGTQTAALAVSGSTATATEEWNGSTWTTKNNISTGPGRTTGATSTAAISMGGSPSSSAVSWNGTSWTNLPSLASGRTDGVAFGTQALAIYAGGYPNIATTEEWTTEVATANSKTLTTS